MLQFFHKMILFNNLPMVRTAGYNELWLKISISGIVTEEQCTLLIKNMFI